MSYKFCLQTDRHVQEVYIAPSGKGSNENYYNQSDSIMNGVKSTELQKGNKLNIRSRGNSSLITNVAGDMLAIIADS